LPLPRPNKISFVWLELTQNCNLRCIHCYEGAVHDTPQKILSLERWKEIIAELSELGCHNIQFIGGEPCCYPHLAELLTFAKKFKFDSIVLFTNATLLDKEIIEVIAKNNIMVKISIYGGTEKSHDKITQIKGSFAKLKNNIQKLLDYNIQVKPSIVLMRENQDKLLEIKEFIISMGLKYQPYDVIRPVYCGSQIAHMPTNRQTLNSVIQTKPAFIISKAKFNRALTEHSCWFGEFAITDSGDVYPCEFVRNIVYGNVLHTNIKDILQSDILNRCWHLNNDHIYICKDCEYRYACKDCRTLGIAKNGNLLDKTMRCTYNPYTGIWENNIKEVKYV